MHFPNSRGLKPKFPAAEHSVVLLFVFAPLFASARVLVVKAGQGVSERVNNARRITIFAGVNNPSIQPWSEPADTAYNPLVAWT